METKQKVSLETTIPSINMSDLFFNYGVQESHTERGQIEDDAKAFAELIGRDNPDFVEALVQDYFDRL